MSAETAYRASPIKRDRRGILRLEVESLLPENALYVAKVAEQSELAHIERMAVMFDGGAGMEPVSTLFLWLWCGSPTTWIKSLWQRFKRSA